MNFGSIFALISPARVDRTPASSTILVVGGTPQGERKSEAAENPGEVRPIYSLIPRDPPQHSSGNSE